MLSSFIVIQKNIHMNLEGREWATSGIAKAYVWAAPTVENVATSGEYYIKGQGRGKWWNNSNKLEDDYRGGCSKSVSYSVARLSACPTWSGVHMRARAKVDNQFGETEAEFEWK